MPNQFHEILYQTADALPDAHKAANFVSQLKPHSADLVAELRAALNDPDPLIQAAAAFALGHLNSTFFPTDFDRSSAIPKLLKMVSHDEPMVGYYATVAVALIQIYGIYVEMSDEEIAESYLRGLEKGDLPLKIEVATQLRNCGPPGLVALPALSRLLNHADDELQGTVRQTIERLRLSGCPRD